MVTERGKVMSKEKKFFGPTYEEMLYPEKIDPEVRAKALKAKNENELDPINLFNINWKDEEGKPRKVVLPKEMTGIDANIIVLLGKEYPSGSHKVGPAYATLVEGYVDGEIGPEHTILGPSTGNFGIGVSYICNLMGYKAVIIMPDNMSKERYDRIKYYGGGLDLTPGTESDVILTLQRTHALMKDPTKRPLAQFELLPNYRFHRYVTGNTAMEAAADVGNGRIACFVSSPGSGGTIGAGDEIKKAFPECKVAALEPYECATLAFGGRGQHRIEGIGDKMCTLIHNVLNTDFITLVSDEDCVRGLKIVQDGVDVLVKMGVDREAAEALHGLFGVSGIMNIIGAIKMAKHLRLGPEDNIVTVATDSFDRYESVLEELEERTLETSDNVLERWFKDIFLKADEKNIYDFRSSEAKEQLFKQKEKDWLPFGYTQEYIDSMRDPQFWEDEYSKIPGYNEKIKKMRG